MLNSSGKFTEGLLIDLNFFENVYDVIRKRITRIYNKLIKRYFNYVNSVIREMHREGHYFATGYTQENIQEFLHKNYYLKKKLVHQFNVCLGYSMKSFFAYKYLENLFGLGIDEIFKKFAMYRVINYDFHDKPVVTAMFDNYLIINLAAIFGILVHYKNNMNLSDCGVINSHDETNIFIKKLFNQVILKNKDLNSFIVNQRYYCSHYSKNDQAYQYIESTMTTIKKLHDMTKEEGYVSKLVEISPDIKFFMGRSKKICVSDFRDLLPYIHYLSIIVDNNMIPQVHDEIEIPYIPDYNEQIYVEI